MIMLVLITLGLCSLLLGYDFIILKSNMMNSISTLTRYIQNSADARLQEIQRYSSTLELHETNSQTKKQRGNLEISQEQYRFSELVSNYKLTNLYVEGAFLYYPNLDLIIGDLGCFKSYSYYMLDNNLNGAGYVQWIQQIKQAKTGIQSLNAGEKVQFCSIKNMMYKGEVAGSIIFRLNIDKLLLFTDNILAQSLSRPAFGIMWKNEILSVSGNENVMKNLLDDQVFLEGESKSISSDRYLLHAGASQYSGLHYLIAYYLPETLKPLLLPLLICVVGIIIIGAFGIIFSITVCTIRTQPLQKIMEKLGDSPYFGGDEYELIGEEVDSLISEKKLSITKLHSQHNTISGLLLNMVLNSDRTSEKEIFHLAERYDIELDNPYYLIGIIKVLPIEDDSLQAHLWQWFENRGIDVILSFLNSKYIILFKLYEETDPSVLQIIMTDLLNEPFWTSLHSSALGLCYDTVLSITTSYLEAMKALNQSHLNTPGSVICYDKKMENQWSQGFSLDYERMTDAISQKNYQEGKKHFQVYFARCSSIHDTPSSLYSILKPFEDLLVEEALKEGVDPENISTDFFCYKNRKKLKRHILELLDALTDSFLDIPQNNNFSIAKKAKVIINRDFTDSLLGLYCISVELGVSQSYLSSTFKKTYQTGVIQYINKKRIHLAKKLILNTEMSIKEIALAVGFSSDISFIRVFKKYESRTPNTLRTG